jgi:hypothetical protein
VGGVLDWHFIDDFLVLLYCLLPLPSKFNARKCIVLVKFATAVKPSSGINPNEPGPLTPRHWYSKGTVGASNTLRLAAPHLGHLRSETIPI